LNALNYSWTIEHGTFGIFCSLMRFVTILKDGYVSRVRTGTFTDSVETPSTIEEHQVSWSVLVDLGGSTGVLTKNAGDQILVAQGVRNCFNLASNAGVLEHDRYGPIRRVKVVRLFASVVLDLKVDGLKGVFVQVERLLHDRSEELTKGWDAVQLHERVAILDEIRRDEGVIPLRSEIDRVVGRELRVAFVFPEVWCDATSHLVGFPKQGPTVLESFVNPRRS